MPVITAKDTQFFVPAESVFENKFFTLSRQHKLLVLEKSMENLMINTSSLHKDSNGHFYVKYSNELNPRYTLRRDDGT